MKKVLCILFIITAFYVIAKGQKKYYVYFESNSSIIPGQYRPLLDSLTDNLRNVNYKITLLGHADSIGNEKFNLLLSRQRTTSVAKYLHDAGLDTTVIDEKYYGEVKPVSDDSTEESFARNRCVEIIVLTNKEINTASEKNILRAEKFENDTTLLCANGAQIIIAANAFYPNKLSEINFNISEVYTVCDILKSNTLMETEDGNCLSSAGMLYIKPTLKSVEVQPNKGQLVTIKIPMRGGMADSRIKLYFAVKNSAGNIVWKEKESELTYENIGLRYYVFRVDTLIGFNLDRLLGITCKKDGPRIKVKGFKKVEVYQTYPDETYRS